MKVQVTRVEIVKEWEGDEFRGKDRYRSAKVNVYATDKETAELLSRCKTRKELWPKRSVLLNELEAIMDEVPEARELYKEVMDMEKACFEPVEIEVVDESEFGNVDLYEVDIKDKLFFERKPFPKVLIKDIEDFLGW